MGDEFTLTMTLRSPKGVSRVRLHVSREALLKEPGTASLLRLHDYFIHSAADERDEESNGTSLSAS